MLIKRLSQIRISVSKITQLTLFCRFCYCSFSSSWGPSLKKPKSSFLSNWIGMTFGMVILHLASIDEVVLQMWCHNFEMHVQYAYASPQAQHYRTAKLPVSMSVDTELTEVCQVRPIYRSHHGSGCVRIQAYRPNSNNFARLRYLGYVCSIVVINVYKTFFLFFNKKRVFDIFLKFSNVSF